MGATTITYTMPLRRVARHLVQRAGTFVFTGTYATGGDTFAPVFGRALLGIQIENPPGRIVRYDQATGKLLVYEDGAVAAGALDEVPDATDLTATPALRFTTLGKK